MTDENKQTTDPTTTNAINISNNNNGPTTPMSKSPSNASLADSHEGSPSKPKKHGFSKRLTKMSLFGRMWRGGKGDHHSSSSSSNNDGNTGGMVSSPSRDQLNEYLQSSSTSISLGTGDVGDDTSSVMGEEEATILWEEDGNVKAATPVMLIRRATDEKFVDANLISDVLLSYRSFITPAGFLDLLMKRFEYSSFVALRVCDVLKKWIEKQWCDFDTALTETLVQFIKTTVAKDQLKNVADQLLKIIAKKSSKEEQRPASLSNPPNPPKPLLPLAVDELDGNASNLTDFGPNVTFWSFPSKEIVRQLTIIEQKLYQRISPPELISQVWAKRDANKLAPNVIALINHFNKVSAWVCSEIVSTQDLQQRIEKVLQLIDIAQHFFSMNNFNSLMAVLAGLHSSSVHRMKRTWGGVTDKPKETFEWLTEFMSSAKNYSQYRDQLQKAVPPVLPYLGVYLSDLTFIEDGNPGEIGNMVNFSKCRQLAATIRKILDFQQTPYTLVSVPFVQNYFNDFTPMDDKMAYEHSTKLEPRTMSTHQHNHLSMGSATSSAAAAAVASLTSSLGVDNYDTLSDSNDLLVGDDAYLGDPHLRFRKDLIRSRNNSLNNVGEPFPVKIQLPGSLPVEMRMPPNTTAKQAVKHFADFFSGITEQYQLVVMPSRNDAKGLIFPDDKIVKDIMDSRAEDKVNTKLALFASPLMVNVGIFAGTNIAEWKDILVDMGAPLFSLVAVFQDIFHTNEEFAYLAYNQQTKKSWWMNMHKSLEANFFERPACILVIFLLSNFLQKSVESLAGSDKQGVLLAGGREGTLKVTTMRQHFAVLSGPFLLLFKTKSESAPSEVVALERYSIQQPNISAKHVSVVLDRSAIFSNTGYAKSHYSLSSDTDSETRVWLRAFQRNCGLLGDKVIFGEELDRCAKHHLPSVVQKTINFIYSHALQQDGLFKSSANSSLVQHYKNQFDQGVEVEFTRTNDACTVAQLLLLYFQELPNPLLTYDLFPKFMEFGLKPPHTPEEEIEVLRDLVSTLSHGHVTVLNFLLAFLSQVSIENPIKLGIANIFGPLLMRPPPYENEPKNYKDVSKVVLGKLIKHREKVFVGIIARRASENVLAASGMIPNNNNNATPEPKPTSQSPDNNDPLLKELAASIGKQLADSAAIAKKVEMLKSQLENKYKVRRQISFQTDDPNAPSTPGGNSTPGTPGTPGGAGGSVRSRGEQHLSLSLANSKSASSYRNHKSVSFVTRPTFHDSQTFLDYNSDES